MKQALVLSGGSVKGAFQVGVIKALAESGFQPSVISGTSVGSLNGLFLVQSAAKQQKPLDEIDWNLAARELEDLWLTKINKPEDIIKKRTTLGINVIFKQFKGLTDTSPIFSLIDEIFTDIDLIRNCPVKYSAGTVNITSGEIEYALPAFSNFLDYVKASISIPIIMPIVNIGGAKDKPYFDGGIRDIAPMKPVIENDVDQVVCVTCQSKKLGSSSFNNRNLMSLADRILEIVVNEIVNNDIRHLQHINFLCSSQSNANPYSMPLPGKKKILLGVIRPVQPIEVPLDNFDKNKIEELISTGYHVAREKIKSGLHGDTFA